MVEQKALKKANDTSKRYLGNIADDYVFLENKSKTQQDCIGIKGGRYDGIVFKFGKIASVQDPQNPGLEAVLKFQYTVVDYNGLKEEHLKDKMKSFEGYQVNEELVNNMNSEWRFMHCLPAHRGDEVTDWVMDHDNSIVFDQAENRMWAQMSLLAYLVDEGAWQAMSEFMGLVD